MNIDFFGTPTLVGLVVKLERPMDREHPCCRPICCSGPIGSPRCWRRREGGHHDPLRAHD